MSAPKAASAVNWDAVGIICSTLCAVHCVAMPFVFAAVPLLSAQFPRGESIHQVLAALVILISALSILPGYRVHRKRRVVALMAPGLALILFGAFFAHELSGEAGETVATLIGSALLVSAHLMNRTFCRWCAVCTPPSN